MNIKIRKATTDDVNTISYIHALSWKSAYIDIVPQKYLDELKDDFWAPAFMNWISNNKITVQIILENDFPVGCIAYGQSRDKKIPEFGEIISLYILPDCFGKGFGQKLLEATLLDMKNSGYENIYLWVLKENKKARSFYEKNRFYCTDDECTCEIMGKELIDIRYVISLSGLTNI